MRADRTPVSGLWPALRSGGRLFTLTCHWGERWRLILDFEPCTEKYLKYIKTTHSPAKGEYLNPKNPESRESDLVGWVFVHARLSGHQAGAQTTTSKRLNQSIV